MFNTTLTDEYLAVAQTFGFGAEVMEQFSLKAVRASLLTIEQKQKLETQFQAEFVRLRAEHLNQ
jgi:adenosine deaminase